MPSDRTADRGVHRGDALRDPHGADGCGAVNDRHRRGEDLLAERVARAFGSAAGAPCSALADLRAFRVARAEQFRSGAVGKHLAGAVDDDHPPAHRGGGRRARASAGRYGARREQVCGGRGYEVGFTLRLRAHLAVHPCAETQRKRHTERDDREQHDVGECGEQSGAKAYGSASSGAAKRKPTPRTVWM